MRPPDACWTPTRPTLSAEKSDVWVNLMIASLVSPRRTESCRRPIKRLHNPTCVQPIPWNKTSTAGIKLRAKSVFVLIKILLLEILNYRGNRVLTLLEAVLLALVEQICLGTSEIDNLGAAVAVLFLNCALFAVIGIRNSSSSTDHTSSLKASVVALVANSN